MSDFGALITFKKLSGTITESDKELILEKLNLAIEDGEYDVPHDGKKYDTVLEWEDDKYCVQLTAYEDGDDADEIRETAEEDDVAEAEEIIASLLPELGGEYEMEAIFTEW